MACRLSKAERFRYLGPRMKKATLSALVAIIGLSDSAWAQTSGTSSYSERFLELSDSKKKSFTEHLFEAQKLFNQKRIFECLDALTEANLILPNHPNVLNLYGACYVEFRDFKKATRTFEKALKEQPEDVNVLFNLAEISFVTHDWNEALKRFEKIQTVYAEKLTTMQPLIQFKVLLCKLKLGKVDEVRKEVETFTFKEDNPLYYYGNAAISYYDDEAVKAEEWLGRARRVFGGGAALAPWQDTLIEFGYVKSFYGGDLETANE